MGLHQVQNGQSDSQVLGVNMGTLAARAASRRRAPGPLATLWSFSGVRLTSLCSACERPLHAYDSCMFLNAFCTCMKAFLSQKKSHVSPAFLIPLLLLSSNLVQGRKKIFRSLHHHPLPTLSWSIFSFPFSITYFLTWLLALLEGLVQGKL